MTTVISVENLSKVYRLGQIGTGTISRDLEAWWAKMRGKPNPMLRIGETDHGNRDSEDLWALKDVSFTVKQGEVLGIIGKNGAGKSTLLKILSRVTAPTSGRVRVKGRIASLLEVGTGFHPELTGRENTYLNGAILGMSRDEIDRKFDEIVDFAEVEKFIDTPVKRYSSGMYVRLAFAVAAHLEPEILLVDEVLAVGDAEFQKKCLGKMGGVAKEGRTVLFVSHNMVSIESLCFRTIVLENGKLGFDGLVADGISNYLQRKRDISTALPLKDRKDRSGSGEVQAIEINLFNQNGETNNKIGLGENFSIEIKTKGKLKKAVVGILIGNFSRTQITRGYTWEQIADDIELLGDDIIRCDFKSNYLMHGSYSIHIWIGQYNRCSDYVENAAELIIYPKDIFNTGRILDPTGGLLYSDAEWKINNQLLSRKELS